MPEPADLTGPVGNVNPGQAAAEAAGTVLAELPGQGGGPGPRRRRRFFGLRRPVQGQVPLMNNAS